MTNLTESEERYAEQAANHMAIAQSILHGVGDDAAKKNEFARILIRLCFDAGAHPQIPNPKTII